MRISRLTNRTVAKRKGRQALFVTFAGSNPAGSVFLHFLCCLYRAIHRQQLFPFSIAGQQCSANCYSRTFLFAFIFPSCRCQADIPDSGNTLTHHQTKSAVFEKVFFSLTYFPFLGGVFESFPAHFSKRYFLCVTYMDLPYFFCCRIGCCSVKNLLSLFFLISRSYF